MIEFKLLVDENIASVVIDQLTKKNVEVKRVSDFLPEGTPDPDMLEFAHESGYVLLTHDERITSHISSRRKEGKDHSGVFIAGHHLQGQGGVGTVVTFIAEYHELRSWCSDCSGRCLQPDHLYLRERYGSGNSRTY